jgi:hypothetical protein
MADTNNDWLAELFREQAEEEAALDAWLDSRTPEQLAETAKRYPEGLGTWTRNPYLD